MQIHIVGHATGTSTNRNFYDLFPYRNVPGTPRLTVTAPQGTPIASATADEAGAGVFVATSTFDAEDDVLYVSGLTYCVGLIVLRFERSKLVRGVVAHFNGHWELDSAWNVVDDYAKKSPSAGVLYAIVVLTSDSTAWDRERVSSIFETRLGQMGIRSANILLYHSNTSGVAFLVRRDGLLGEPSDKDPFNQRVKTSENWFGWK